jgi:hypothetical protein
VQIHFVGQGDDLLGASDDAQLASLTPFGIHLDSAFQFCHILSFITLTSYKIGCKGSENRAKCKEKRDFSFISEMHPTFDERQRYE